MYVVLPVRAMLEARNLAAVGRNLCTAHACMFTPEERKRLPPLPRIPEPPVPAPWPPPKRAIGEPFHPDMAAAAEPVIPAAEAAPAPKAVAKKEATRKRPPRPKLDYDDNLALIQQQIKDSKKVLKAHARDRKNMERRRSRLFKKASDLSHDDLARIVTHKRAKFTHDVFDKMRDARSVAVEFSSEEREAVMATLKEMMSTFAEAAPEAGEPGSASAASSAAAVGDKDSKVTAAAAAAMEKAREAIQDEEDHQPDDAEETDDASEEAGAGNDSQLPA